MAEDSSGSVAVLVISGGFLAGAMLTYPASGLMAAVLVGIGSAAACGVGLAAVRLRRSRLLDRVPDPRLEGLTPHQALAAISAVTMASGSAPLRSEVLDALARVEQEHGDSPGAVPELERLSAAHPRSPAVAAALARAHRRAGDADAAARGESNAIGLALDGGMNPAAADLFLESPDRDRLALETTHWDRLARAVSARGEDEAAEYCRKRARA